MAWGSYSSNVLTNPGAETGDLTGWTVSGSGSYEANTSYSERSGTYSFTAFVTNSATEVYQDYTITDSGISTTDIDAGKFRIQAGGWGIAHEAAFDEYKIKVQFLDNAKSVLSTPLDTGFQTNSTFTNHEVVDSVAPTNSRYVRVIWNVFEDGNEPAGSIDDMYLYYSIDTSSADYTLTADTASFTLTGNDTGLTWNTDQITFVGVATGTATGASSVSADKADISGLQDNDFVIAIVNKDDDIGGDYAAPSGWTITDHHSTTAGRDGRSAYAYKYITDVSSEPTSWTFTSTNSNEHSIVVAAFRNVDSTTPIATTTTVVDGQNDSTPDAPNITTGGNNEMVVSMLSLFDPQVPSYTGGSAPSELSTAGFAVAQAADTSLSAIGYAYRDTAGAFTIGDWTSGNSNIRAEYHVRTISLTQAAASGYSITADTGSFTLTGQDTGLHYNRVMSADTASFTLTGIDANLLYGRLISADTGTYNLTGYDTGLIASRRIAADSGSYTLTGYDVTLTYNPLGGYTLVADAASFVLTDHDVNLLFGRKLTADTGAYTLTAHDVGLLAGRLLSADVGTFTLTDYDVSLLAGRLLSANSGTFVLTGHDTGLTYNPLTGYSMVADTALYTLTDYDVNLLFGRKLTADTASFNINSVDVNLLYGRVMQASGGTYTLTPYDVNLLKNFVLLAATGAFTLTGYDTALTYSNAPVPLRARLTGGGRDFGLVGSRDTALIGRGRGFGLTGQRDTTLTGRNRDLNLGD